MLSAIKLLGKWAFRELWLLFTFPAVYWHYWDHHCDTCARINHHHCLYYPCPYLSMYADHRQGLPIFGCPSPMWIDQRVRDQFPGSAP